MELPTFYRGCRRRDRQAAGSGTTRRRLAIGPRRTADRDAGTGCVGVAGEALKSAVPAAVLAEPFEPSGGEGRGRPRAAERGGELRRGRATVSGNGAAPRGLYRRDQAPERGLSHGNRAAEFAIRL